MSNLKRIFFLLKSYSNRKRELLGIFISSIILICLLTSVLIIIKTNETATLEELFETYGRYTASIKIEEETIPSYKRLAKDSRVKNSIEVFEDRFVKDQYEYVHYYADSEIIEFENISLVEGEFPRHKNEILIERSYLFYLGKDEDEMIGSTITLPLDDKGTSDQFVVTGIIKRNIALRGNDSDKSVTTIFPKGDVRPNKLLIQIHNIADYLKDLDYITEEYSINRDTCYVNFDLFMVLGIAEGDNTFKQNEIFYNFLFFIILLCTVVSMYNFIKLMVYNSYSDVAIMNLMGVSKQLILAVLFLVIILTNLLGTLLGILLGFGISSFVIIKFISAIESVKIIITSFPYKMMINSILIYNFIIILIMLPIFIHIKKLSPNLLIQKRRTSVAKQKRISKNHLFQRNTKFFISKIAKDNITYNRSTFFIAILGIACSILILISGFSFLSVNLQAFGHDTYMDYRVTFNDEFTMSEEEISKKEFTYVKLTEMTDICKVYSTYIREHRVEIKQEALTNQYIKYLKQSAEDRLILGHGNYDMIPLKVVILGYNNLQLQELYKKNGQKPGDGLKDNEVIVLSKTIPVRGRKGFPVNFKQGDIIDLNLGLENDQKLHDFKIKTMVSDLNTYPQGGYNQICIIINESIFKKWNDIEVPRDFYIKLISSDDSNKEEVKKLILEKPYLILSVPIEEEAIIAESNRILKVVLSFFFIIIILVVGISIMSTLYMRIYIRETEYAMLSAIGLTYNQLRNIILYEIIKIYIYAIFISGVLSYFSTLYIQVSMLGAVGKYIYRFPYFLFLLACLITLMAILLISFPALKRLKKMNTITLLNSDM